MSQATYYVGLDVASEQFYAAMGVAPWTLLVPGTEFPNQTEGLAAFDRWLAAHHCTPANAVLCMEATGVYGEELAYHLAAQGYRVAIEPPLVVKRAFKPYGPKTDAVDSQQIAEYACRYADRLRFWQPRPEWLEHLQVLLATREHLVQQRTAHKNNLHALQRKVIPTPAAEAAHRELITACTAQIAALEKEIRLLFQQEPPFQRQLNLLLTIPGVGLLLAAQFLVVTQGATRKRDPKVLAAHLGIAPMPHASGKAVWRPAQSRGFGPPIMRKLLHLAARSVCTHDASFRTYYQRKLEEGKPKRVVVNNVANRLVKIMCAIVQSQTAYDPNYRPRVTTLA
jgi:transposase